MGFFSFYLKKLISGFSSFLTHAFFSEIHSDFVTKFFLLSLKNSSKI